MITSTAKLIIAENIYTCVVVVNTEEKKKEEKRKEKEEMMKLMTMRRWVFN